MCVYIDLFYYICELCNSAECFCKRFRITLVYREVIEIRGEYIFSLELCAVN